MLRQVGRFLGRFGYDVCQCAEPSRADTIMVGDRPDFLILDGDIATPECIALCRAAGGDRRRKYVYTFLVTDESQPRTLTEAIQAGVDDFLSRPVVYGELLARLRAGARVLEYERRVRQQAGWDPLTGLLSRQAFLAKARALGAAGPLAYALLELDHLASLRQNRGDVAADEVVEAMAGWLDHSGGPVELLAHCQHGRFAAFLRGDERSALQWAEQLCGTARDTEFACGGTSVRVTLSIGIAPDRDGSAAAEDCLTHAAEALVLAQQSGHDGAATYGQCVAEEARWSQLAQTGQLFDSTLARHVMTPNTITLRPDDPLARCLALFRQTGLQAIPVVDDQGTLQGIVPRRILGWIAEDGLSGKTVAEVTTSAVTRFEEGTPMNALMEHFLGTDDTLAVIVCGDCPTGIVSRRNLRTLIEPLSSETFSPRSPFVPTSDYLLVPDLCPARSF
jgi:GGDEF domain-containing protein/predicted transcriptional regulator